MAISEVQSPGEGAKTTLTEHPLMLSVNGEQLHAQVMADTPLLLVLRNDLALNGPKYGCGTGECGACTVLIDGVAARSCVIPALGVSGRAIVTSKALAIASARTRCSVPLSKSRRRNAATASTA